MGRSQLFYVVSNLIQVAQVAFLIRLNISRFKHLGSAFLNATKEISEMLTHEGV